MEEVIDFPLGDKGDELAMLEKAIKTVEKDIEKESERLEYAQIALTALAHANEALHQHVMVAMSKFVSDQLEGDLNDLRTYLTTPEAKAQLTFVKASEACTDACVRLQYLPPGDTEGKDIEN